MQQQVQMQVNWASIVESGKLVLGSTHEAKVASIFPNRKAWSVDYPRVGAIAVFQGEDDFALSQTALTLITNAKADKRIDEGYILLIKKPLALVNVATVDKIAELVIELSLNDGRWGSYWWLPPDLANGGGAPF